MFFAIFQLGSLFNHRVETLLYAVDWGLVQYSKTIRSESACRVGLKQGTLFSSHGGNYRLFPQEKPYPDPLQTMSPTHPLSDRMKHSRTGYQKRNHYWTWNPAQPTVGIETPTKKDYHPKGICLFSPENGPRWRIPSHLPTLPKEETTNHFQPKLGCRKPSTRPENKRRKGDSIPESISWRTGPSQDIMVSKKRQQQQSLWNCATEQYYLPHLGNTLPTLTLKPDHCKVHQSRNKSWYFPSTTISLTGKIALGKGQNFVLTPSKATGSITSWVT